MSATVIAATSAAVSTNAAVLASANAARISALETQNCIDWMPRFDAAGATAETARAYATCVARVYPQPSTSLWPSKPVVGSILAAAILGVVGLAFIARRSGMLQQATDWMFCIILGPMLGCVVLAALALLVSTVRYLAS